MAGELPPQLNLDATWDACHEVALRRCVYSSLAGAASALLFLRSPVKRWATVAFATGVGLGSAYTDCSHIMADTLPKLPRSLGGSLPTNQSAAAMASQSTPEEQS